MFALGSHHGYGPPPRGWALSEGLRKRVDDIFKEVDNDLRADRTRRQARRYGIWVAGLVVLAAVGLAGWQGWQFYEQRQDMTAAGVYLTAMQHAESATGSGESPARTEAIAGFEKVAATAPEGYRTLARLRAAALQADGGQKPAALVTWQSVADDTAADPLLRDLANLLWVEAQLDTGEATLLQARLDKLTAPTNPWRGLAQEAQALLDIRQGHTDAAKRTLQTLARDITAAEGTRGRANALLARLGGG